METLWLSVLAVIAGIAWFAILNELSKLLEKHKAKQKSAKQSRQKKNKWELVRVKHPSPEYLNPNGKVVKALVFNPRGAFVLTEGEES